MPKWKKYIGLGALAAAVGVNVMAYWHAFGFTHFGPENEPEKQDPMTMRFWQKARILLVGSRLAAAPTGCYPSLPYKTIYLKNRWQNACWYIANKAPKGMVILLHGYGSEKSRMLGESDVWQSLGYSTMLMDFGGSGESTGDSTSIGYYEAEQVRDLYEYVLKHHPKLPITLAGASMGAVALLRATSVYGLKPAAIVAECPYASLRRAVLNRFKAMGVPQYPFADLLLFWGGVQERYNPFEMNVVRYAKDIKCPTLLMCGGMDERVAADEVNSIFEALTCKKKLITYPLAGHENYLLQYKNEWIEDVKAWEAGLGKD